MILAPAAQPRLKHQEPVVGIRKVFGNDWVLPATVESKVKEQYLSSLKNKRRSFYISPLKPAAVF